MGVLAQQVVAAIQSVVGDTKAGLHEPEFTSAEYRLVQDCLDSTMVSSVGEYVERFEENLAEYTGSPYVVAMSSGTAALHIALLVAGVGPDDEVLVPALSFVATANAVVYCGAIPHFIDSDTTTLGMDPGRLRDYLVETTETQKGRCVNRVTGRTVRALVPMHAYGHPLLIDEIVEIGKEFNLTIIEDAAEALGSTASGKHMGTFGDAGILSFNGNKIITTGGGGALLTGDRKLASRARHLSTTAKIPHKWKYIHDEVGFNYRMPNVNAAIGCAQLTKLSVFVERKRELYQEYKSAFSTVPGVRIFEEPEGCRSNYWLQTLILDESFEDEIDEILEETNRCGYMTRPAWIPLHKLKPYETCPKMRLEVAESLARRIINLPSSPGLMRQ
ncbi:MAG TPA: LegC family aminotransferase [Gammaproteobacteria bacterium]|nr:LegC family aminotransferase [Gammaproteobacteria bacterium]